MSPMHVDGPLNQIGDGDIGQPDFLDDAILLHFVECRLALHVLFPVAPLFRGLDVALADSLAQFRPMAVAERGECNQTIADLNDGRGRVQSRKAQWASSYDDAQV